jgi:general secretion pathway protein C
MKHMPLVAASALFVAVCASAAYWSVPWLQQSPGPVVAAPKVAAAPPAIAAAAGLFGGAPAAAPTTFQLKGVIADGPEGVAILAAEGKPAVSVGVNQEAAPGVTVQEIHLTWVMLNEGGTVRRLDLPSSAIAGLEIVAAADDRFDAPARPVAPRMPAVKAARSGGAMPLPMANPNIVKAPGESPPQLPGTPPEVIEQLRRSRPSGIGPGAWGAMPHG